MVHSHRRVCYRCKDWQREFSSANISERNNHPCKDIDAVSDNVADHSNKVKAHEIWSIGFGSDCLRLAYQRSGLYELTYMLYKIVNGKVKG